MSTKKLPNLPVRTEVKGGLNPQPLPPRYAIAINVLRYRF